jgi:hypothetical protein
MTRRKASMKSDPTRTPDHSPDPVLRQPSPQSEMGAEDESASDASRSKEKPAPARKPRRNVRA